MVGIVSTTARLYFWTEVSEAEGENQQPKYLKAVLYNCSFQNADCLLFDEKISMFQG